MSSSMVKSLSNIEKTLLAAWEYRVSQQVEKAFELAIQLRVDDSHIFEVDFSELSKEEANLQTSYFLLLSSLSRAHRQQERCHELFGKAANINEFVGEFKNYFYYQELAISYHVQANYYKSYETFSIAKQLAPTDKFKVLCLVNILIALDNLGLNLKQTTNEIELLVEKSELDLSYIKPALKQFETRENYRAGDFNKIFSKKDLDLSIISQNDYFRSWVKLLPYHKWSLNWDEAHDSLGNGHSSLYQGLYRLRTLQCSIHPDDLEHFALQDAIDRMYLWVWRWLRSPEDVEISKIEYILNSIDMNKVVGKLTVEDQQLFVNSLLWLGLFGQSKHDNLLSAISKVKHHSSKSSSLLEFEYLVIKTLYAMRDGEKVKTQEYRQLLEQHNLWNSKSIHLSLLVKGLERKQNLHGLEAFISNVQNLIAINNNKVHGAITVNKLTNEVIDNVRGVKIISEPMVKALDLFTQKNHCTCEEFVEECFSLINYDSFIHDSKIYNLLARVKNLGLANAKFFQKQGVVYLEGDLSDIQFIDINTASDQLNQSGILKHFKNQTHDLNSNSDKIEDRLQEYIGKSLKRKDLEYIFNRPRSSVNRIIAKLVDKNILIKTGAARSTTYLVKGSGSYQGDLS